MPSSRREVVPRAGVDGRLRQDLARRHTNRLMLSNAPLALLSPFVSTWSDAPLASPGGNRWLAEAVFGRGQGRVVKLGDLRLLGSLQDRYRRTARRWPRASR